MGPCALTNVSARLPMSEKKHPRMNKKLTTSGVQAAPLFTAYPFFFDHESLIEAFKELLESGILTNRGPLVHRLERQILNFMGWPGLNAVTCANATLALELTLRALEIQGKVIVTPLTFV